MNKSKIILVVSFFLSVHSLLFAMPIDTTSIVDNIYNLNFSKAKEQLSNSNEKDYVINKTMNLEIAWWMAIVSKDEKRFSSFLDMLSKFERADQNDFTEIITSTYRMRYYACVDKAYKVPLLVIKVRKKIEKIDIKELEQLSKEEYELFELYKSFFTLVEKRYYMDVLVTSSPNKQELINNIERIIRNGSSPNRTIALYFLMKYYLDVEKNKNKANNYLVELHKQYPCNIIFTQLLTI